MECAGIGYAMENADEKTKAAADRISPPNTVDGVAQVLEALVCGEAQVRQVCTFKE